MLTLIICVFVGILHIVIGEPYLDTNPLTINSVKGRQVVLPCVVRNLGYDSIIWFSPTGQPIAKDLHIYTQDARFSIQQPYATDFNLAIENVNESDEGVYICMVFGGMDEKRITLEIKSPPKLDDKKSSPNAIIIREAETLSLKCSATGKPPPVIQWYRSVETEDGQMPREDLGTTGSVLTIKNIVRENTGSYECVASNNLLPNVSREMIVTVHYKPQIYATTTDKFSKKAGQNVILECIAEGFPLPYVSWQRRGKTISRSEESQKIRQTVFQAKDTLILSLRINDLNDNDFGMYTCEAENMYGQASHDYAVEKTGAPKIEVASTLIRRMRSETAELECRVRGFPRGVVWFKSGEKLTANRRINIENYQEDDVFVSSLKIITLSTNDFSVYICQADNEYGSDEMEIRLEQSEIDISGPSEAKVGHEIALVCNATTNSIGDDSITWLKNGQKLKTSRRITASRDINMEEQRIFSKLYIRDMKIGDKGIYTCKTKNFLVKSHSLSIMKLPDEFVNIDRNASSRGTVTVKENSGQIKLLCKVEAYPRRMVYWYKYIGTHEGMKKYTELTSGEEDLILNSDRSVAGTYQCRASNGRRAEETLDIVVDVQYSVMTSVSLTRMRVMVGMPLTLDCNITGNPMPYAHWSLPKGRNTTSDYSLELVQHTHNVLASMRIKKMKIEYFGTYKCVGGNKHGRDSTSVAVRPIFPTTTTTATTTTTVAATTEQVTTKMMPITKKMTTKQQTAAPIIVTEPTTLKSIETNPPPVKPTEANLETDKESVKQDDNKSCSISCSYVIITLTVLFTFPCIYYS